MSHKPPVWYFDKAAGWVVFCIGILLLIPDLLIAFVLLYDRPSPGPWLFGLLLFTFCGTGCLHIGRTLIRRAGQD
jgi:hypothetical protein